jgi:hypothetical protein
MIKVIEIKHLRDNYCSLQRHYYLDFIEYKLSKSSVMLQQRL